MKGDMIFSRSAWGRNEARNTLGITISKGTLGSIGVAKEYWLAKSKHYEHLPLAVDETIVFAQDLSPTDNGDKVRAGLHHLWDKWKPVLLQNEPEARMFREIIVNTGVHFKDMPSIGRRQLQEKLLTEICNHVCEA